MLNTINLGRGLQALFATEAQPQQENVKLTMDGQEVHSLAELRERFVLSQSMDAFLDGRLEAWLENCYYEDEAQYDDFGESHTSLAIVVHEVIKAKIIRHFYLSNTGPDVCDKEYKSKFAAQQAARTQINKAYDEASALFDPSRSTCIVSQFTEAYANRVHSGMDQLLERLEPHCTAKRQKELFLQLAELTEKAEANLKELFFAELRESADYYKLYQKQYFCDRVAVEQDSPDVFVSDFMNGVARVFGSTYTVSACDFCGCMAELQENVDSRVNTFADAVHQSYKEYCEKMEEIAEELGKDFSKEDLERFGLIET